MNTISIIFFFQIFIKKKTPKNFKNKLLINVNRYFIVRHPVYYRREVLALVGVEVLDLGFHGIPLSLTRQHQP